MKKKLDSEDYKNFNELEKKLLSLNDNIKYTRDFEIESQIKYDLLCDKYSLEAVDNILFENNIEKDKLFDINTYSIIIEKLEKI